MHGDDGLGGIALSAAARAHDARAAVELIDHLASRHPDLTVLALGPLTNLAAYAEAPGVALFDRLVVMGGAFAHSGNVTAWAEANIHNDPEAAALVFAQDWDTTLVPLDVTMTQTLDAADLVRLEAIPVPCRRRSRGCCRTTSTSTPGSSPTGAARCTTRSPRWWPRGRCAESASRRATSTCGSNAANAGGRCRARIRDAALGPRHGGLGGRGAAGAARVAGVARLRLRSSGGGVFSHAVNRDVWRSVNSFASRNASSPMSAPALMASIERRARCS